MRSVPATFAPSAATLPSTLIRPASVAGVGTEAAARHHLEMLVAATLEASLGATLRGGAKQPKAVWREALSTLATGSRAAYRALVYETDGFVDAFYAMTPIEEISALN